MYLACGKCKLQYDVSSYNEGTQIRCKCGEILAVPAQRAAQVSCASCGAQVPHDARQCPYCKGAVRRGVCPRCFHALRPGAKFCDECGAPIRPQVIRPPEATDVECPRCQGRLFHVQLEGHALDQCSSCGGLWIDAPTVERIMAEGPAAVATAYAPDTAVGDAAHGAMTTQEFRGRAYIPCPVCGKIMTPRNWERASGVIVDVCKDHGVWFDAGELGRILEWIAHGGLQEARRKEAERAKEEARAARAAAAAARMQAARGGACYGEGNVGHGGGDLLVGALIHGIGALLDR